MRIRSRLIVAFLALGLFAALSVGVLSIYATRGLFADYSGGQRAARLAQWRDVAAGYYAQTGSWTGIETILAARNANAGAVGGMGRGMGGMGNMGGGKGITDSLVLTDNLGVVIAGALPTGQQLASDTVRSGEDIVVSGITVGKMVDLNTPTDLAAADAEFLTAERQAILAGAVLVAIAAVALGALLARRIAAPISALTAAVSRGGGDPVPVSGSGEVRQLAEEFNGMLSRLGRNEQVRRTMVSDIAHELRTPLTVLSTHLESLGGRCTGETAQEVLSLQDEVLRMNRLVGDLQTLSLADAGALVLNRRSTDLQALLARIVELTSPVASERGISVELDAPGVIRSSVDPDRITQAVLNLVTNALRHTPGGGRVTLRLAEDVAGTLITVADNGPGISPADLPHVFERFYRADPSRSRVAAPAGAATPTAPVGGSGLGLAIVRGIVEAHGGRVWVESRPGEGAQFFMFLSGFSPRQRIADTTGAVR